MRVHENGVTLVELMTVVVILGILASIAVPSYRSYLLRTNRTDAKSALMQLQAAQEKFYLQNNAYTDKITNDPPNGLGLLDKTTHGYYKLTVALTAVGGVAAQGYTAKADPVAGGGQSDDTKCGSFTLTDVGKQGVTGTVAAQSCWK